jgi:hypothetical protein
MLNIVNFTLHVPPWQINTKITRQFRVPEVITKLAELH